MDVGCGSGILSFFAAQAGARKVYAVEASNAADDAEILVHANGMSDIITVVRGKIEEVILPEKADILISEPMGTLLLNERMIESYIAARDLHLRPGGLMFPTQSNIYLAPFCDETLYAEQYQKALFFAQAQ